MLKYQKHYVEHIQILRENIQFSLVKKQKSTKIFSDLLIKIPQENYTLKTNMSPKNGIFEDDVPNFPFGGIC